MKHPCLHKQTNDDSNSANPELSVIIPTVNRAKLLHQSLESILDQTVSPSTYEIIVVDNNSIDDTEFVIKKFKKRVRYIFESEPGLLYARHTGANAAKGRFLIFADDDIVASKNWIEEIFGTFIETGAALIGGKIIPRYEGAPPSWMDVFWSKNELGIWNIYFSLIDLGENQITIPANFVFGCNFSIRKEVLFECGGFHPDALPTGMIRYRGDGEYGLARKLMSKNYTTIYNPHASIVHLVSKKRMTVEYFCKRAFNEGITNSYTAIRENKGLPEQNGLNDESVEKAYQIANLIEKGDLNSSAASADEIQSLVAYCYRQGVIFHRHQVFHDHDLLEYILLDNYYMSHTRPSAIEKKQKIKKVFPVTDGKPFGPTEKKQLHHKYFISRASRSIIKGKKLFENRAYSKALSYLDIAMYLSPMTKGIQYMRALCLLNIGRRKEAEIACQIEENMQPDTKNVYLLKQYIKEAKVLEKILSIRTHLTFLERKLLFDLANKIGDNGIIVEIGSWNGASTCFLAEGSRKKKILIYCIDTWQDESRSTYRQDIYAEFKLNTTRYGNRIIPYQGDSQKISQGFTEKVDLLSIVGNCPYEKCRSDFEAWLPMLKPNGMVVLHDFGGDEGAKRAVQERLVDIEIKPGKQVDSLYFTSIK
jgi:glycosyltransferase involved in cell wall biosynthesis